MGTRNGRSKCLSYGPWPYNLYNYWDLPFSLLVSYPDPNVRKHYRLQYNTAYIGSGQESCSWECNWNVR